MFEQSAEIGTHDSNETNVPAWQRLHGEMNPAAVSGVQPETHFRELLTQVPLVMQQFEAAIREELGIDTEPPSNARLRFLVRKPALDDLADIGQDLSRER